MFFFRAETMLQAIEQHLPELATGLERIERSASAGAVAEAEETERVFPTLPAVSIDYGIMEHVQPLHVVPGDFGWSDLGSWHSAWELSARDEAENAIDRGCLVVGGRGNLVRDLRTAGGERTMALVGVDDLCVVQTDDAVLVIPRERAQDVRLIVEELRRSRRDDLL